MSHVRRAAALLLLLLTWASAAGAVEHVIHVSVDGLNASLLLGYLANDPNGDFASFARIRAEGATTFNARTDYTHTITLPNHTSMITGRPVSQPAGQPNSVHHGYVGNTDPAPGVTLHNGGNPNLAYVASVFDVVHDHGLSTAHFASKSKFVLFERSYDAAHGAPDATGADDGSDKIDQYVNAAAATMHASLLASLAANHWNYVFVHYSNPDDAGHATGWGSATYRTAVATVDDFLGDLMALVEGDAELDGRTLLVVSTDHGGTGIDHSNSANAANYTIPFLVWGAGVEPGADLYALNAGRRLDPGTGRPDYNAPLQPIRNGETGNLALGALGLPPVPGSTIGASLDLETTIHEVPALPPAAAVALALLLLAAAQRPDFSALSRAAAAKMPFAIRLASRARRSS
jgi:hypothetical protein